MKKITRSFFLIGLVLIAGTSINADFAAAEDWTKTIDYGDSGYSETGNWASWTFGRAVGGSYRYLTKETAGVENRKGKAFWKTKVPVYGRYRVEISYRRTANRTTDADFFVHDGFGDTYHFIINQKADPTENHLTWTTLGTFHWHKDEEAVVELDGTDDTRSDEADAAKWTLVEELEPVEEPKADIRLFYFILDRLLGEDDKK